jgi:hypothetical protein
MFDSARRKFAPMGKIGASIIANCASHYLDFCQELQPFFINVGYN